MAKFNTPIENSPFNPFSYEDQVERITGKNNVLLDTPITGRDPSLELLSGVNAEEGFSLLSNDAEALETRNETLAQAQGSVELGSKMLFNIGSTVLFELAKLPGYIGGGVAALSDTVQGKENPISNIVDNFWVTGLQSLQDETKELIPVHIQKDVAEGNLLDKATSGQWWATTGADGIGFLISMMVPGQASKLLGLGAKVGTAGEAMGNSSKILGKTLSKVGLLEDVGKSGQFALKSGAASSIDSFAAATLNTYAEAAAEGANTFSNVKAKAIAGGATEEEANMQAGNAAAGVFKANMALLMGSNLLDEAWLWKGFSNSQKGASNKILDQIFKKADDGQRRLDIDALKNLSTKGWKDSLKLGAKNFSRQFVKEGFFEEGSQTTLQQNIEKEGDAGVINNLYNVGANYFKDFLSNDELHESIFLGGVLGGGMSVFQTKNEINRYNEQLKGNSAYNASGFFDKLLGRKNRKEQKGLTGLFSENYINNFSSILDVAEKDENGKPIIKDGKIVVNEEKLFELAESKANAIDANIKYNLAVATGDKIRQDAASDILTFNYLQPFLNQEGGYEVFKEHIPQLEESWAKQYEQTTGKEATAEQRKQFSNSLQSKAGEFNDIYKQVESTHLPERFVPANNTQEFQNWKSKLFNDKINLALQNRSLQKTKKEIQDLKAALGSELTEEDLKNIDPIAKATLKLYETFENEIKREEPKLSESFLKLFTREGVEEHREDYLSKREEFKAASEKVVQEEISNIQEANETKKGVDEIRESSKSNGYEEGDIITLENEKGERYSLVNENGVDFIYNQKGEKKKVVGKLIENLNIKIVPKDKITKERKEKELEEARQSKLSVINEIVEYREKLYSKTIEEIKSINESLEKSEQDLKELSKELESSSVQKNVKKQKKNIEEKINSINKIISELQSRKEHLENLRARYELLLEEYKLYQSYLQQANINFSELKDIIETELLSSIKDDSANISNDIVETQKAINRIKSLSKEFEQKLKVALETKETLEEILSSSNAFQATSLIIATKKKELYDIFNDLFSFTEGSSFEQFMNVSLEQDGLQEILSNTKYKNRFIRKLDEIAKNISPTIANKYFGKDSITRKDLYNLFESKFDSLEDDIQTLRLTAEERATLRNEVLITNLEIEDLKNKLEKLDNELNLQNLNKQYVVLEEINKEKVEKQFVDNLIANDVKESIHQQREITSEAPEHPERISEVFLERQLGVNRFVLGGLNVLYETEGKNKGFDILNEEGLPTLNFSIYQQHWYKTMDKLSSKIDKYNLLIYKAKYDESSELEKQLSANNPNISNRTESDLFAILVDENNSPVKEGEMFTFTSVWRPEVLYGDKPRIAPDAILQPLLAKIGVPYTPYKGFEISKLRKADIAKINKYLNVKENNFTLEQLYEKAKEESRIEYTNWYNSAVDYNNNNAQVYVKPEGVTSGKPLQRRDENRNIIWGDVLTNLKGVKLQKGTGASKLSGAKFIVAPRSGQVVLDKNLSVPASPGDTLLVLNQDKNVIPVKARNISEEEAMLSLYLLSLADKGATATVPLPKGVSYKIGDVEIKDKVVVFFYQTEDKKLNASLKNFSLLHSIINYGEKTKMPDETEEHYKKRSKGTIYAATKTKRIIYTDFNGEIHVVSLNLVKEAFEKNNFSEPKVAELLNFLKQKRFNISQNLIEQNNMFPYPKLINKTDSSGKKVYSIEFDNTKSYYEFLLQGDSRVLSTNIVSDARYPQFLQRNLYFNPMINTTSSLVPLKKTKEKKKKEETKIAEEVDNTEPDLTAFNSLIEVPEEITIELSKENKNMFSSLKPISAEPLKTENPDMFDALRKKVEISSGINSLEDIPDTELDLDYADKLYSPMELLTYKIQKGEIKENCK